MTLQDNPLDFNDVPPTRKGRTSRRMSVTRVAELLNDRIADLAVELLGTPNRALSSAQQLRFGTKGSIAVEIAGKDAGRWYDHEAGTGGAGPELIRHHFGMDEKAAWDWARHWLGDAEMPASWTAAKPATTKPAKAPASGPARTVELTDAELAAKVAEIVRQTEVPNGTPAHAYLAGRGIAVQPPDCIRFRRNAYGSYGAMVALATDAAGEVLAIQQVYLTAEGKKAPVNPVKRTNKAVEGWGERSAVRLPGREPLVLCEGVETALSVWQATGQEVWACLGVSNIGRAPVPEKAMVIIARDGDAPGSKAEGQILRGAAQSRLGHVEEGLASMQQGINYFRRAAQFVALRRGLGRKVDALVAAGRPADALAAQREQYDLSMRLYSSNRAQGVARLQVEEDVARREDEIRRLSTENQLQEARVRAQRGSKLAWMVVSVLGGGVILLLALLLRSTRRQREALWKDALTGAFTRHHLERWRAGHRLHAPARRALVLIDLDYFKAINDQHGHAAGDEVLRGVGARLRGELDRHGELFRWGGEEFLLVQDVPADADIEAWLARLQRVVQRDTPWVGQMLRVSASMGCLVLAGEDAEDARFDTAVRLADTALYMAKAEGRACAIRFVFAGEGLDAWHRQPPCRRDELQAWRERGWVQIRRVPAPD